MKQQAVKENETTEITGAALYQSGVDAEIKKEYEKAELFYKEAVEKKHVSAHCQLACLYLKEYVSDSFWRGAKKKKAKELLLFAAEKGHRQAMLNLAYQLALGDGVPEDLKEAMKWYNRYLSSGINLTLTPQENSVEFINVRLKLLFSTLEINNTLIELTLSGIPVNDTAINYLVNALKSNKTLLYINLSHCQLSDKAIICLRKALSDKQCKTVLSLDLTGNVLGEKGDQAKQHIEQCLKANQLRAQKLVEACCEEKLDAIEQLIADYASPYVRDSNGNTVFHCAARMSNIYLMQRLLLKCPDINLELLVNEQQYNPLMIAEKLNDSKMKKLLKTHQQSLPLTLSAVLNVSNQSSNIDAEQDSILPSGSSLIQITPTPLSPPTSRYQSLEPILTNSPQRLPELIHDEAPISPPFAPQEKFKQPARLIPFEDIKWQRDIGEGHYGVVFEGFWRDHTTVAVKKLRMQQLSKDATEEFYREAEIMACLLNPRVVQLYGICNKPYCLVMEYMEKGSLFTVLHSEEVLDWSLRQRIGFDIACGLDFLHAEGVLHRDLKSLNVLLDANNRAKLADFGLSKIKSESRTSSSKRQAVGTCAWSGPEILQKRKRGEKAPYSPQSDMYSYGMILWEIASRKAPFLDAESDMDIRDWVVDDGIREIIPEDTPAVIKILIKACWEAEPAKRPTAAYAVKQLKNEELASPEPVLRQVNLASAKRESYEMYASDFNQPAPANVSPYSVRNDRNVFFQPEKQGGNHSATSRSTQSYEMYASDFSRVSHKK